MVSLAKFRKAPADTDDKRARGRKLMAEFESMRNMAELKAYSAISQERPLTDKEFNRMKTLAKEEGIEV